MRKSFLLKLFVLLGLCVSSECHAVALANALGQDTNTSTDGSSPSPSPAPVQWSRVAGEDRPFTEQHRAVTRNGMLFFQGVLNVLWIGTLLGLHVVVDNKLLPARQLLFLNTHIVPALAGPVQMKLVVFTNGLLALSRGANVFLNSMWGGIFAIVLGFIALFFLYVMYLYGQKKTKKAASEVSMNAAHKDLSYQLKLDRMNSLREKLRKFREYHLSQDKTEILEKLVDTFAITDVQRKEVDETGDSEAQRKLMESFELKISKLLDKVISGEKTVDENFCCDLGTNPKGAVVRYWNSHKSLYNEMSRLAHTEYFKSYADQDALRDGTLGSQEMRKFLMSYMQAKNNKGWSDTYAPPVTDEVAQRVRFGMVSEQRCCLRDPFKDGGEECIPVTRAKVLGNPDLVPSLPSSTVCEANCEFEPHTLQAFCDSVYKFRVKPASLFYPAVYPLFMFSISFFIVAVAFVSAGYSKMFFETLEY